MRTVHTLSMEEASLIAQAIVLAAQNDQGDPIAVSVVGADGSEIIFARMDGVLPGSVAVSKAKAWTCIQFKKNTLEHHQADPPKNPANYGPGICFMAGGVIVQFNGEIVGAIGVSGRAAYRKAGHVDPALTDHELAEHGRQAVCEEITRSLAAQTT